MFFCYLSILKWWEVFFHASSAGFTNVCRHAIAYQLWKSFLLSESSISNIKKGCIFGFLVSPITLLISSSALKNTCLYSTTAFPPSFFFFYFLTAEFWPYTQVCLRQLVWNWSKKETDITNKKFIGTRGSGLKIKMKIPLALVVNSRVLSAVLIFYSARTVKRSKV